jgi:hypothetical protein
VGRKEKAKSYWRNEDLSQLRIGDQVKKFLVSGVGDGGVSDVCRLALISFDPLEWAKKFESVSHGALLIKLRNLEARARKKEKFNLFRGFTQIYNQFNRQLTNMLSDQARGDIERIVLNGRQKGLKKYLHLQQMSFLNAWLIFLLNKKGRIEFEGGKFLDTIGNYVFDASEKSEHFIVVRHGTHKTMDFLKEINPRLMPLTNRIKRLQEKKAYNDFSITPKWDLPYWESSPASKRLIVPDKLNDSCSVFLSTLEGVLNIYLKGRYARQLDFRATLHRLLKHSDGYFFQQVCRYVGTRKGSDEDVGRAFQVTQGLVGLGMRTDKPFLFVRAMTSDSSSLFNYGKIFARQLSQGVESFLVIPIPTSDRHRGSVFCFYLDSKDPRFVRDREIRNRIYWLLSSFVRKLDSVNVSEINIGADFSQTLNNKKDDLVIERTPGINRLDHEISRQVGIMRFQKKTLIDLY